MIELIPKFEVIATCQPTFSLKALSQEKIIYNASPDFIRKNAGPIGNLMLNAVPAWYYDLVKECALFPVVDVRVIRLKKGEFMATPGWHIDGDWKSEALIIPHKSLSAKKHLHIIGAVSSVPSGIGNTLFWDEALACELNEDKIPHNFFNDMGACISANEVPSKIKTFPEGSLVAFNSLTLHRCQQAKEDGIRLFFRMNMWPNHNKNPSVTTIRKSINSY